MIPQDDIAEAIEVLAKAEKLIAAVDRVALAEKLNELREFVDDVSRLQLALRMARLRLQSLLPADASDRPTPVVRPGSTAAFRKVDPQK